MPPAKKDDAVETTLTNSASQNKSLTSNPDLFSQDCWNLLLDSENEADRWRHEFVNVEHVLQVLFTDENYRNFIKDLPINCNSFINSLEDFLAELPSPGTTQLFIGEALDSLLDRSDEFRRKWGSKNIEISHLLLSIGRDPRIGSLLFEKYNLPSELLEAELRRIPKINALENRNVKTNINVPNKKNQEIQNTETTIQNNTPITSITNFRNKERLNSGLDEFKLEKESDILDTYGTDLTESAKSGLLDPVIGREEEINLILKVLSRRNKNNPILIGSPGVGKTAIAELLAQEIVSNNVPDSIKGLRLISLDIGALIAGTKFRGQLEERLRSIFEKASDPNNKVILFIDEIHTILNTDRSSSDAGSFLKPVLAKGELKCIGATTPENYRRTLEKDQALNIRFQKILIKEPSISLSVEILRGLKDRYEKHHGVTISDDALITANQLGDRYISDRCLPDKAIDLIDEASAQIKIDSTKKPSKIEEKELRIEEINKELLQKTEKLSDIDLQKIDDLKFILDRELSELYERWNKEKSIYNDLKQLTNERNDLIELIATSQQNGDLEESARLQYEELPNLQKEIANTENTLKRFSQSEYSLIKNIVTPDDIAEVVSRWTSIPVNKVLAGEKEKLLNLTKELDQKVIGQSKAVEAVSAAIKRARAGMKDIKRPIGSFLFLGPTGVGKTELAKALANSLFDEEEALVRLDMSEFMERNAVARLLGAPPGYVGYEEGGQLTEAIRRRPYAVLLLDEIEKAHPDVFNILLQVLDDGRLTDSQGRTVNFQHTVIILTSNLASKAILENTVMSQNTTKVLENQSTNKLSEHIDKALKNQFRPEFLNRIDEIVCFNPLSLNDLQSIIQLQLEEISHLLADQNLQLRVDASTIESLANEGFEPEYGARPLRRILRRRIENPLATKLLEDKFINSKAVRIKGTSEQLEFFPEN